MVLRRSFSVILVVLVGFAFAGSARVEHRAHGGVVTLKRLATCPQLPSGAEPDVLDPSASLAVNYAVSVTPDGGSRAWGTNTSGDTSTYTVTNTGACTDTYEFTASGTSEISAITLSKATFTLGAGQNTTVKATYHVGVASGAQLARVTLLASATTGGESDSGWYNISIFGAATTPDAQPITVTTNSTQAVRFLVRNTGNITNTYTLTCSASGNETCSAVIPSKDTLPAGWSDSVTVDIAAGATGTGIVTLQAVGSAGGSDNGSYSMTNTQAAPYAAMVTPHTQTFSAVPNISQTLPFGLTNSGTVTNTYSLSCAATGNDSCGMVTPSQVTLGPGGGGSIGVSVTAGAGGTGTVKLRALGLGGASDSGTYSVTNIPGSSAPPVTSSVSVTPDGQVLMENLNSSQPAAFIVQNTGTTSGTWNLSCTAGNHETCGAVSPGSVNLAGGASAAVTVNFTSDNTPTSSSLSLYATGTGSEYGISDFGIYNVTNASAPPGPNYAVNVMPKSTSGPSWLANTTGHLALFTVWNIGTTQDAFDVTCAATGTVTCAPTVTSVLLKANSTAAVAVTYGVGAPGSGVLTVKATGSDGNEHDSGYVNVAAVAPIRGVSVTPDNLPLSVSAGSTDTLSFQVLNTGQINDTFALTCVVTVNEACGTVTPTSLVNMAPGVSNPVTVTVTAGGLGTTGTVWLRAVGNSGVRDSGSYAVTNTHFAAVTPDAAGASRLASRAYADTFTVRNPGSSTTTYNLGASCSGTGIASGCTPSLTKVRLASGVTAAVSISYTTGVAGAMGVVKLIATDSAASTVRDSGWSNVTIGTAQAPVLDVTSVNPGTTRERSLCLTIAASAAGEVECGDLRVVHPLPATTTRNKLRAPTVVYNSAEARPYPLVAANVTLLATAATPDTVSATLTINSTVHGRATWPGSDWTPGAVRRIVVADTTSPATGIYSYTLAVTNIWNGSSSLSQSATGQVAVVNRRQSAFGAGWWLAGVERLYTDSMFWVGGDGSTRRYASASTNVWAAPNLDRPDTLKKNPTTNQYTRLLPHGVHVVFDATGHHIFTVGRVNDTTRFTWSTTGDSLLSIVLPPIGLTYQFTYTSGSRWVVTAPSTPVQTRADTGLITGGRLTAIGGPDNSRVTFGYGLGADSNLIVTRIDRRGFTTTYGYDGGKKVIQSRIDMGVGQSPIARGWQPLETVGYPLSGASHAMDTAFAAVRYDGPRTDVWDTTAFWLDRFGAPRRIVNALGYQTVTTRADPHWPALVTQVQAANGLVTQAVYDSVRGNPTTVIQVNPLADGQNDTTRYAWDPRWDFVASVTLPNGEVTQFAYDTIFGNRQWQQPGTSASRRVTFNYNNAFHLLSSVVYPTSPAARDSIRYDALGNVDTTMSPLGFTASFWKDGVGRDTVSKSPLDSAGQKSTRQRVTYDAADRVILQVSYSDSLSTDGKYDSLIVRNRYDQDGNLARVITKSRPDRASLDSIVHGFAFDRANRMIADTLVGTVTVVPFRWDLAGNLTNGGREGGNAVTIVYDALSRPILRLGADTASFTYDTLGRVRTANNSTAQVARVYYPSGALKIDTLRLATDFLPAQDFTRHIYVQRFGYDRDGRRLWALHPAQLGPAANDSIAYTYEPVFGQLAAINDVFGNHYTFSYDSVGRTTRIVRLAGRVDSLYETLSYDQEGRLAQRLVSGGVLQETLKYDARGKATGEAVSGDALAYAPLGPLVESSLAPAYTLDLYTSDALANRTIHQGPSATNPDTLKYERLTGRLLLLVGPQEIEHDTSIVGNHIIRDTTFYFPDAWGQTYQTHHVHYWHDPGSLAPNHEDRNTYIYYDVAHRLVQTRYFLDTTLVMPPPPAYTNYLSTESYRYDALGRRVYARVVRGADCVHKDQASGCLSTLTRTVWDGDQVLYELRGVGDTGSTSLEADPPGTDAQHGVVGYLHAGGIDQPLALWKGPPGTTDLVLPYANWRGAFVKGTCPSAACGSTVWFPANDATVFGDPPVYPNGPPSWHGSIIESGRDASGYQYKRNRYYDPATGRFTQEDPLGLAGGLNLYGFAGGDPVNFSDPFGLFECTKENWSHCRIISFSAGLNWGIGVHGTLGPIEARGQIGKVGVSGTISQTAGGEVTHDVSGSVSLFSGKVRVGSHEGEVALGKCETGEGCHLGSATIKNVEVSSNGDVGASVQVGLELGVTLHVGETAIAAAGATTTLYNAAKNWILGHLTPLGVPLSPEEK